MCEENKYLVMFWNERKGYNVKVKVPAVNKDSAKVFAAEIYDVDLSDVIAVALYRPLKKYWFACNTPYRKCWENVPQNDFNFRSWKNAVIHAKGLSKLHNCEVRISETEGYNNQGHYFWERQ